MKEVKSEIVERLRAEMAAIGQRQALSQLLGDLTVAGGLWRFFSPHKASRWNSPEVWRHSWSSLPADLYFFGEDLWGNQLTLKPGSESVWLWNHENGELVDLLLDPVTLLETVIQSGIEWIDFYTPEMLTVGRAKLLDVPEDCHLHWTQPLILGGTVNNANTSVVEGAMHLRGHGDLSAQLNGLPLGTQVVVKQK